MISQERTTPRIVFVVPCYNEEDALPDTIERLVALLAELDAQGAISSDSYVLFVDDGSRDRTWDVIVSSAARERRVAGLKLSANRGHQNALLAGLQNATGDATISIDADLQDDLTVIPAMIAAFLSGSEIVYAVRQDRSSDTRFKRFTAESYYRLLRFLGATVVFNHADYRLMSRQAIDALRSFTEVNLFLRGVIPMLGFRSSLVGYTRQPRTAGVSKYPVGKMVALALDGVTSLSATPLRIITVLGTLTAFFSLLVAGWALWVRLVLSETVPGWTSTVVPLMLVAGVQLLAIGVVGEYVAKIYMETKRRPRYIVERAVGSAGQGEVDS